MKFSTIILILVIIGVFILLGVNYFIKTGEHCEKVCCDTDSFIRDCNNNCIGFCKTYITIINEDMK